MIFQEDHSTQEKFLVTSTDASQTFQLALEAWIFTIIILEQKNQTSIYTKMIIVHETKKVENWYKNNDGKTLSINEKGKQKPLKHVDKMSYYNG